MRGAFTTTLGVMLVLVACERALVPGQPGKHEHRRVVLSTSAEGLSGLTIDDGGRLYAIPERDRRLVILDELGVVREVPLFGVPKGVDAEAIAWMGGSRFAIGTETMEAGRAHDEVLIIEGDRVVQTIEVPYGGLGRSPEDNGGIEGICVTRDRLVVSVEQPLEDDGRHAILAWRALGGGDWVSGRVRLTSSIGKLSALSCDRESEDGVYYAIERGRRDQRWVGRIVRFRVPAPGRSVEAETVVDLGEISADRPNPEGLVLIGDRAAVVMDNHYGIRIGPNELWWIEGVR